MNIAQAADCRDFVRSKQEEEASRAAQKRKKEIAWGYDICPSLSLSVLSVLSVFMFAVMSATCDTLELLKAALAKMLCS